MSSIGNQTGIKTNSSGEEFPIAAIVCLAVGAYVAIVIIIIVIRYVLLKKGTCQSECCQGQDCCTCNVCVRLNAACPCCCTSNADSCLSKLCGQRKRTNCIDILFCNCCGCTDGCCDCPSCGTICCRETNCCREITCCREIKFCNTTDKHFHTCFDCWDDEVESNTCTCFCLAVKLRSPRQSASIKRSNSVPHELYYNTHVGKQGTDLRHTEDFQETENAYTLKNAMSDGHSVRKRSKSHSPHFSQSHVIDNNINPLSPTEEDIKNSNSYSSSKMKTRVGFNNNATNETLKRKSLSSQLSSSLSDVSNQDLSSSGGLLIKPSRGIPDINSKGKSMSRARRSVKPGQRSQRFPNKILVTSESLNAVKSLKSSSDSEDILFQKSITSKTLPQPTSLRSLPELRQSNT
ncbi:uncharacterized protein LOC106056159 [Biomphalaria glabrata]|uniref:Uncharacterized protein LOC106056159 n=1 Tax=Biomphalaria glabrata TaxID=6526 RepID=A0A2C9KVS6_BIOGL|nr:uncharacterized protein LOC106056159 [Biomphalaria glabrata]KAI8783215.1 scavenger receptor class F member 1 [Biomphalaria glabrata]